MEVDRVEWSSVAEDPPPEGLVVMTKIHDEKSCRNVQTLKRVGRLFFTPCGTMYVYYTPTHWRRLKEGEDGS